jgi:hypothetical protein
MDCHEGAVQKQRMRNRIDTGSHEMVRMSHEAQVYNLFGKKS